MIKQIIKDETKIEYELIYKNVKNINLRINSDGRVSVSANRGVSEEFIEKFLEDKIDFIKSTIDKYENIRKTAKKRFFDDDKICGVIRGICEKVYPYFQTRGVDYPTIKFRKMKSQWGNCYPKKGVLTFNTNLVFADYDCIEYVVMHEFVHFLEPNHSKKFYDELEKVCPEWGKRRAKLKKIFI